MLRRIQIFDFETWSVAASQYKLYLATTVAMKCNHRKRPKNSKILKNINVCKAIYWSAEVQNDVKCDIKCFKKCVFADNLAKTLGKELLSSTVDYLREIDVNNEKNVDDNDDDILT